MDWTSETRTPVTRGPIGYGLLFAIAVFLAEFTLMQLLPMLRVVSGVVIAVEFEAYLDAVLLGSAVGLLFLLHARRWSRKRRLAADRSARVDAFVVLVLAIGFQATLHTPLKELTLSLPPLLADAADAFIMAALLGAVAAWLRLVHDQVARHGAIPKLYRSVPTLLTIGALLAATYVAAMPSLSVVNNMMAWSRVKGVSELVNLAGRQRMLAERIAGGSYRDDVAATLDLEMAASQLEREGARVTQLGVQFVENFLPDGRQDAAFRTVDKIASTRVTLLTDLRTFLAAPDKERRAEAGESLRAEAARFVEITNAGVQSVAAISDAFVERQLAAIPVRLVVGGIIIFLAVLGLIWPILKLVAAQRWKLNERRLAAEQAARAKAQFLANIGHELRTPLTSLLGYTNLMDKQAELSPQSRQIITRAQSAGQGLLATINDLLEFSALEAGHVKISPRAVDLRTVFGSTLTMFEGQASERGIALRAVGLEELPAVVTTDPDRLRQILMNLIGNALKFVETGYVEVTAEYDARSAVLSVAVEDSGAGIAEEDLNKLFQRFSQVDGSLTRKFTGTGLGLSISKGLVDAMGGSIGVKSIVGSGSTFWFTLPIQTVEIAVGNEIETAQQAELLQGYRILVMTGSDAMRQFAAMVLELAGGEVTSASTVAQGVGAAIAQPFDVMLIDEALVVGDDVHTMLGLRNADGLNANVPIVALSSEQGRGEAPLGHDERMTVPFTARQLLACLNRALKLERPDIVAA